MNRKTTNVLIVGVGGQGIILAGELLAKVALDSGYDVKKSEVHGMAQRGGSVNAQVRFGPRVFSPIIPAAETDVLLSFEKMEPLRWLSFTNPRTVCIVNDHPIHSLTTATCLQEYPRGIEDELGAKFKNLQMVPALPIAKELGNPRVVNVLLLGLLARRLEFPRTVWDTVLRQRIPSKVLDVNLKAFDRGYEMAGH